MAPSYGTSELPLPAGVSSVGRQRRILSAVVLGCLAAVALLAVVGTSSQADEPEQWSELASVLPGSGDEDSIETAAEIAAAQGKDSGHKSPKKPAKDPHGLTDKIKKEVAGAIKEQKIEHDAIKKEMGGGAKKAAGKGGKTAGKDGKAAGKDGKA